MKRFNEWLAVKITDSVSTMTCAYLFALLAITGLPGAVQESIHDDSLLPVDMWLSQNFLQLVLLSVIMVGGDIRARRAREMAEEDHKAIMELVEALHDKHDALHEKMEVKL